MQYIIQCTDLPDTQNLKLLEALKELNLPHIAIGVIPFTETIHGLEGAIPNMPAFLYGSTRMVELFKMREDFKSAVFYEPEWFDPYNWPRKRDDLLNEKQLITNARVLREVWVTKPTFIKSIAPKLLTGMVIEPDKEDRNRWIIEHSNLNANDGIVMSPIQKIDKEWRFFIVDGEVITGSLYRRDGYKCTNEIIDSRTWDYATLASKKWLPSKDIVMDLALMRDGTYKVIEFNCINCSGFYNCYVAEIVRALELRYIKYNSK